MGSMVEKKSEDITVVRFWGIPIEMCLNIFQTVGLPTIFMVFILYLVWSYLPPVASAHIRLLERTGDTLEKMDQTLKQSNLMIAEVADVERQTKNFMLEVKQDHLSAQECLDKIESAVVKDKPNGNQ